MSGRSLKVAWNAPRRAARRRVHRWRLAHHSQPHVAHQGIQRSGTNYVCALLERSGYFVLNRVDPPRNDPAHKHFRWQADKTSIVMDSAFDNELHAGSIAQVNSLAGFPADARHLVIFKEPATWLTSIHRWGLAHGWVDADADFLGDPSLGRAWLREWDHYYSAWDRWRASTPSAVLMVRYSTVRLDPQAAMARVHAFLGRPDAPLLAGGGAVTKVAHSARRGVHDEPAALAQRAVEALVEETVTFPWRDRNSPQHPQEAGDA